MRKSFCLVLLYCLSLAAQAKPAADFSWDPYVPADNQLFPSFFVALAAIQSEEDVEGFTEAVVAAGGPEAVSYMQGQGRFGVVLRHAGAKTKIRYSIQLGDLAEVQTFEKVTSEKEKDLTVMCPAVVWNFDKLKNLNQPTVVNAKFWVSVDGKANQAKNVTISVRSINDALFAYQYKKPDGSTGWMDAKWIFAAYVNEDHPWIEKILAEALKTGLVNSFSGTQADQNGVMKQVFAVWYVMQKLGFRYSSITDSSAYGRKTYSQYVRLFDDSIKSGQANCVDGSVLFVAILQKIGIPANLVIIPGHCFVCFDNGKEWVGLETTVMGIVGDIRNEAARPEWAQFGDQAELQVSLATFDKAIKTGDKELGENWKALKADNDPRYKLVNIKELRNHHHINISR